MISQLSIQIQMEINQLTKVPLAYGPIGKFLARLEQSPNLNKSVAMTLPRMSFEFTGLTYDPTRKVTTTQQITVKDPDTEYQYQKSIHACAIQYAI